MRPLLQTDQFKKHMGSNCPRVTQRRFRQRHTELAERKQEIEKHKIDKMLIKGGTDTSPPKCTAPIEFAGKMDG